MYLCTLFRDFTIPVKNETIHSISEEIKSDLYKSKVNRIRSLHSLGKKEEADALKKSLPAFTPSATFQTRRLLKDVVQYSGIVHLDYDHISDENIDNIFHLICKVPCTLLCFKSPSGKGLKVFVRVNTSIQKHDLAYQQVQTYYDSLLAIKSDKKCKDITRLCFVSYDPNLFINFNSNEFEVLLLPMKVQSREILKRNESKKLSESSEVFQKIKECLTYTAQVETYISGNRNKFIYLLACNCNRKGIDKEATMDYCLSNYDLDKKEINSTIESAYKHHQDEYAKNANAAKSANSNHEMDNAQDYLKSTPSIPDNLYNDMPSIIKEGALVFNDFRERDVFLTSALAILSGCLSNVKGVYDGHEVYVLLYSFSIAPPASGKGVLKFAKMLGDKYHDFLISNSRTAENRYNNELEDYRFRKQTAKNKGAVTDDSPVKPRFKILFIPANTSYAKVLNHLEQNQGIGIICETEADTMGNALKQDWGGYSDMLRKAFHHERISSSRKTDNEFIEVDRPRLSVSLTGTPGQVSGLISSAEDGLFSRFLFYAFKVEQTWKDVSPQSKGVNLNMHFTSLSNRVLDMIEFLEKTETTVQLKEKHWNELNKVCSSWLTEVTVFTSEGAASVVKRLGLIIFRISMLFTAMRKFENGDLSETVECTDDDFDIALQLAKIYLAHSLLMFNNLPKSSGEINFKGGSNKRSFFNSLPMEFTRQQATQLAATYDMSIRSVDELLRRMLTAKHLTQPKMGMYKKV